MEGREECSKREGRDKEGERKKRHIKRGGWNSKEDLGREEGSGKRGGGEGKEGRKDNSINCRTRKGMTDERGRGGRKQTQQCKFRLYNGVEGEVLSVKRQRTV